MWLAYCSTSWAFEAHEYVCTFVSSSVTHLIRLLLRCRKRIHEQWTKLAESVASLAQLTEDDPIWDFEASVAPEVDILLSSIRVSPRRISDINEHPAFVKLLKNRLAAREQELEENLEKVDWDIDSAATLAAVAGDSVIETVSRSHAVRTPCANAQIHGQPVSPPTPLYPNWTLRYTRARNSHKHFSSRGACSKEHHLPSLRSSG